MANPNIDDLGLPPMTFINEIFPKSDIPKFDRKFTRRQGPASVKKNAKGRIFTVGGEAADRVLQIIFADQGLTRRQISVVAGCSPSRVTEVIWALEAAVKRGQLERFPEVPRAARQAAPDESEEDSA